MKAASKSLRLILIPRPYFRRQQLHQAVKPADRILISPRLQHQRDQQHPQPGAGKRHAVITGVVEGGDPEVEKEIIIPVELITEENVDRFDISGWQ